jgi:hypothetical protein
MRATISLMIERIMRWGRKREDVCTEHGNNDRAVTHEYKDFL